jgi:protein ImuA
MAATLSIVEELRRKLRERETAKPAPDAEPIATGLPSLDALLPHGGWRAGSLVEWLSPRAAGAGTLALYTTARQTVEDRSIVVVDRAGEFFPAACAGWGTPLERLILLRPQSRREELWAIEQALSCSAVGSVVCWQDRIEQAVYRRLQLAAERGGGVGAILRPIERISDPSCAQTRLKVQPRPGAHNRRLRVEFLRGRSASGRAVEVELDDATATVHLAADLARPASGRRIARA